MAAKKKPTLRQARAFVAYAVRAMLTDGSEHRWTCWWPEDEPERDAPHPLVQRALADLIKKLERDFMRG